MARQEGRFCTFGVLVCWLPTTSGPRGRCAWRTPTLKQSWLYRLEQSARTSASARGDSEAAGAGNIVVERTTVRSVRAFQ